MRPATHPVSALLRSLLAIGTALFHGAQVSATSAGSDQRPLFRAHSHNDYEQARPLQQALENRFCSIEADIFLVGEKLLVGHTRESLMPEKTLESLYLEPLRQRVQTNHGTIYQGAKTVHLLIDVKTDALSTYLKLREILKQYSDILTSYEGAHTTLKPVTVIISGNRAPDEMASEKHRLAALDGRPENLDRPSPASLIPWISQSWNLLFQWRGTGELSPEDKSKLTSLVEKAHSQGRQIRFWGLPDRKETWSLLWESGVDWINTDKLTELRVFMESKP